MKKAPCSTNLAISLPNLCIYDDPLPCEAAKSHLFPLIFHPTSLFPLLFSLIPFFLFLLFLFLPKKVQVQFGYYKHKTRQLHSIFRATTSVTVSYLECTILELADCHNWMHRDAGIELYSIPVSRRIRAYEKIMTSGRNASRKYCEPGLEPPLKLIEQQQLSKLQFS